MAPSDHLPTKDGQLSRFEDDFGFNGCFLEDSVASLDGVSERQPARSERLVRTSANRGKSGNQL